MMLTWIAVITFGLIAAVAVVRWVIRRAADNPPAGQPCLASLPETAASRPTAKPPLGAAGSGGCGLLFGLAWTMFSLIFVLVPLGVLISELRTAILLHTGGVTTEAVVISRRIDPDSESDTYYVTYRYWAPLPQGDRRQLTHEESVDWDTYKTLIPESRVNVRYVAVKPETVRLEGQSKTLEIVFLTGFMLFGGLFVGIGLWLIYTSGQEIRYDRLLSQHGAITAARLTDRWTQTDSDGGKDYCVAFCFAVLGQPEITATEINRKAYHTLQVGDPVQVRYAPGKPEICRIEI
ncbi:MAG: DUF3592 domain-containing protein [Anaerolineae bacterium]|nr:DUF3592 domain-containing protein [Anaerolineae bacterium]